MLWGDNDAGGGRRRRLRVLLSAAAAALAVATAAPAAAQAEIEKFESPPLSDGTQVADQFKSTSGIYFTQRPGDGIYSPEIDDDAPARSPTRTLDITTGPPATEFPHPGLEGRFTSAVTDVTVHVRNTFSTAAAVTLKAERTNGGVVTKSATAPSDEWITLEVAAGGGPSFHRFQLDARSGVDDGKEIRVDDVEYTFDPAAMPDYLLATEEFGGLALAGQSRQYEIQVQRLNEFGDEVSFRGNVINIFGDRVTFSPSATTGSSTTATMTLPADTPEGPQTLRIRATTESLPERTLDIPFVVETPFSLRSIDPLPVRPDRCATTQFDFSVDRNRFFDGPVSLRVEHQNPAGTIPPDLGVSITPTTIPAGPAAGAATLNITRGDNPESPSPVPLKIVASSDGVERTLSFDVLRAPPRLSSVAPVTLFAPAALTGGSGLTVRGNGLCPGAVVRFGNDQATAPGSFSTSPTPDDPTRVQLTASTPRLATSGPISVVNPSGTVVSGAGVLPDTTVGSYRNRFGFSFPNEDGVRDKGDPPVAGAGSLRDWQELVGPHQTNFDACEIGLFFPGCWEVITPIPTPQHGLMQTILGEASFYNRGGTCVGLAIASRRIAMQQATVQGRVGGATGFPVWSLARTGRETIRGRGDIPLEGTAAYSPIKYAAIQHPAQTTAEYVELWVKRRSINAVSGPGIMRRALERDLRAGRRPLLNINWEGGGHAVNVYDVEDRPGGGYFIRVYDNNVPYLTSEAGNGADHLDRDQRWSRIEVTPGGSWTAPGLLVQVGTDAAGKAIRGPRTGPTGDLSWVTVENELPVVPSSLASLEGLRALATPGLSASVSASASATKAAKSGVMELGYLDGEGSLVTADSDRAHRLSVSPDRKGRTKVGVFGEGTAAEVRASGGGAKASAKGGGGGEVMLPKGSASAIGFDAGSDAAKVDLTLIADGAGHLARVKGARGGTTRIRLAGKGDRVVLTHSGRPGVVQLELASFGRRETPARLVTKLKLGAKTKATLRPRWKRLGNKLPATVNGKRLLLRNRAKPPVRVTRLRVAARKRGKRAVTRVRARLVGKLRRLDALVVGVEVRRGKKVVGRATKQLKPRRKALRRLARKGIALRPKLGSRKGRLTARATVSAVVAKPLPSGDSKARSNRVR